MEQVQGCSLGAKVAKHRALHQPFHPGTIHSFRQKPSLLARSDMAALALLHTSARSATQLIFVGQARALAVQPPHHPSPGETPSWGSRGFLQHCC